MLAAVRNRRGLITGVDAFDGDVQGRVHLVHVEYLDSDGVPDDQLVWEREPGAQILEPAALPDVVDTQPMMPSHFDGLVRAARWTALSPWIDPDGDGPLDRMPLASPVHGAIQVEDFQLVPLWKAMRMPRISLLLADDVGLGKTIEAGLILTELLLRRRVRRVLIVCPASLRSQWQDEMREKFSLSFDVVDRPATHALQKRLGLDANPWRTFHRVITSYDYLKQADVLEQFMAAARPSAGTTLTHQPWDLLVVDEAHNLSPAGLGRDSDVSRMLQLLAPRFEHRLFLTATPHNGHTRSFTGLLETLDPVRFTQKSSALTEGERRQIEQVVVRRLKSEINQTSDPPRFAQRSLEALEVDLGPGELALAEAFDVFRRQVRSAVARARSRSEELAGTFAVEVLGKRLLSGPVTFAHSWHRYLQGLQTEDGASATDVRAAEKKVREDLDDDLEAETRTGHAVQTVGAWLRPLAEDLADERRAIDSALDELGLGADAFTGPDTVPAEDARYEALRELIESKLMGSDGTLRDDERLVVFTEYKTSLDVLAARLTERLGDDGQVKVLYGGMDDRERDAIKAAFNDPGDAVRVLVATDAAAEGLNLQETARYVLHWDVPWNPSRLEQRNGRLDRHGQARDVVVHHFTSEAVGDLRFLARVVEKVDRIREDLGSVGEVFDRAVERRLLYGEDVDTVLEQLDGGVNQLRRRADVPADGQVRVVDDGKDQLERLRALRSELDIDADTLRETLEIALGWGQAGDVLQGPDERGRFAIRAPVPPRWQNLVDETLRSASRRTKGALRQLVFDPAQLMEQVGPRTVFRPDPTSVLLHLNHPLFHEALHLFARSRYPSGEADHDASRWTVRTGHVPDGADALLLVTIEELAVNELRETFHHWVRTLRVPVVDGALGETLPHVPASQLRSDPSAAPPDAATIDAAREAWDDVKRDVRTLLKERADTLTETLRTRLDEERGPAIEAEKERFQQRQGEVSSLIARTTTASLQKELEKREAQMLQVAMFREEQRQAELRRSAAELEEEIERRQHHYQELREQLAVERERLIERILPHRYAMRGTANVFPVAVEVRMPGGPR
jgi:superfamily II DNA or RNA helicase